MKRVVALFVLLLVGQGLSADEMVKKADLAGSWYPADKKELTDLLEGFMSQSLAAKPEGRILGIISPHAGYNFSARAAGAAFNAVKGGGYRTVVIIGFSHRKPFSGISIYDRGVFETPLGEIAVDTEFAAQLKAASGSITFYPDLFTDENSVEMIIPFTQIALKGAKIVPIAFGGQDYGSCEVLAGALSGAIKEREDVLVIASTDMSHYHPYEEAVRIDTLTINKISGLDPAALYDQIRLGRLELCGAAPVTTLMLTMKSLGAGGLKVLKYENSGDVTGDKDGVVGYLSAVFYRAKSEIQDSKTKEGENSMLNEKQRKRLLEIARLTVEEYVKKGKAPVFTETDPELVKEKGAFVTLHYKGELRGCIGNIIGRGPLYQTVRDMAVESSSNDPRFPPVSAGELKDIKVEISVLSEPQRVRDINGVIMGTHGVIVRRGARSGVFLPQVATETGWSREEFLSNLCAHKAGLPSDAWKDPQTELYSFTADVFGEE